MKLLTLAMLALVVLATIAANLGQAGRLFAFAEHVPGGDQTAHFGLYALLSFAVMGWAAGSSWGASASRQAVLAAGLALLITLEELSQRFIAVRTFSLWDLTASLSGVAAGAFAASRLAAHRQRRTRSR